MEDTDDGNRYMDYGKNKKNLGNTECILVRREGPISINDCELIHRF